MESKLNRDQLKSNPAVPYAIKRIGESGFNKVYVSGEFSYAQSNAKAGGEWFEYILDAGMRIAHKDYYGKRHWHNMRVLGLHRSLEKMDKTLNDTDIEYREPIYAKRRELQAKIRQAQIEQDRTVSYEGEAVEQRRVAILRNRFGHQAVVFNIEMPYRDFKERLASESSKQRIADMEGLYSEFLHGKNDIFRKYSPWDMLQEVHMRMVEPRFIIGYKVV